MASIRVDLRGHGESQGRQEDLTLSAVLNDIRLGLSALRRETGAVPPQIPGGPLSRAAVGAVWRQFHSA